MDPWIAVGIALLFTIFGRIWGKSSSVSRYTVEQIVSTTLDGLEKDGYLKSKIINGEMHYLKWPSEDTDNETRNRI